ncbi:tyrosyl-tRNA synthetase [Histomonas meleagridis]|uniref:tyrosyl-tRNA synthetase n=1 Tax=Histomonas meleagridis TaxID=135588 RepID=UPI00355A0269|nr:tyrosyl-tRNA synthetase [Histomonas meleagridis]KAH0798506.1 tyrosyl-tRNA synthetase [Histomonas meleagridis]
MSTLTTQQRKEILLSIAEDAQGVEKLDEFLETHPTFRAYNGFEPSGRMHIAQALTTSINANAIIKAGGTMVLYIADIFAKLNHKMNGNLEWIHDVGVYFIEVFRACGMDLNHVEFIWSMEFIKAHQKEYFELVNKISEFATLNRIKRTVQIMGRKEGDNLSLSQFIYPCMQAADVFMLGVDFCQLGVDQRKVNMLAIEYANSIKRTPPMILSHHMLMGLKGAELKMSKSDPDSAIFIEDTTEEIYRKIGIAACPLEPSKNPLFEYLKYIILRRFDEVTLCGKTYTSPEQVQQDFPEILKNEKQFREDVAKYVDMLIQPIRDHFKTPELQELLKRIATYRVTR